MIAQLSIEDRLAALEAKLAETRCECGDCQQRDLQRARDRDRRDYDALMRAPDAAARLLALPGDDAQRLLMLLPVTNAAPYAVQVPDVVRRLVMSATSHAEQDRVLALLPTKIQRATKLLCCTQLDWLEIRFRAEKRDPNSYAPALGDSLHSREYSISPALAARFDALGVPTSPDPQRPDLRVVKRAELTADAPYVRRAELDLWLEVDASLPPAVRGGFARALDKLGVITEVPPAVAYELELRYRPRPLPRLPIKTTTLGDVTLVASGKVSA